MKFRHTLTPLFLILSAIIISCTHKVDVPIVPAISFLKEVQPLIIGNCTQAGCHGGDGREFKLVTYEDMIKRVKAGNALTSSLYTVLRDGSMPPGKKMNEADIQTIYIWIQQGALNN